ncbi:FGGY-family carbohydrate kinase [Gracilimonas mengyeensis]|uniref:Sugar (Pentulose or hexulose) kinase n=1 Tax=Gracilimonas mengyeensis TaxID=1302730 RepID=A0A521C499_9BACT|nr:FGGY family carbohydrate kinase [Gracilimonas mengyeensis]SMO54165.1 Sugar (pentulose or hexulose) kinase [Gracilimonas mengyeensis]
MTTPKSVTAVFDIGKTNKKFFLFDEQYGVVRKTQVKLKQTTDDDGDPCEDLPALERWIKENIREVQEDESVDVQALNFSTYGASLVHLDEEGKTVTPLYNYLKPFPEDLLNQFYSSYKGREGLSLETASPPMGMLNSGLQLYWLKYGKPEVFKKIRKSLHFPQYLSYVMTGLQTSELTSIGCHTAMWNFEQDDYHAWMKQEDLLELLPGIEPVTATFPVPWKDKTLETGVGIHDSSAALAPYLFALDEPFMLVSTGTWSITFNPFNKQPLTFDELQRDCLCYLDVYGNQVKAARFFLGNEYSVQKERLMQHFDIPEDAEPVDLDPKLMKEIIQKDNPALKLKLHTAYNSGPYPQNKPGEWDITQFDSYQEAYHQLMLDLASIQAESIKLAGGDVSANKLVITGGFSQNEFFIRLLACFFPEKEIYTSSLPNASALGAAMVVNDDSRLKHDKEAANRLLGLKKHEACKATEAGGYRWKESVLS